MGGLRKKASVTLTVIMIQHYSCNNLPGRKVQLGKYEDLLSESSTTDRISVATEEDGTGYTWSCRGLRSPASLTSWSRPYARRCSWSHRTLNFYMPTELFLRPCTLRRPGQIVTETSCASAGNIPQISLTELNHTRFLRHAVSPGLELG